jgi:hypothetical protein
LSTSQTAVAFGIRGLDIPVSLSILGLRFLWSVF